MRRSLTVQEKIHALYEQIRELSSDCESYSSKEFFPVLETEIEESDVRFLSEERLTAHHKELEEHFYEIKKFKKEEQKGFEDFIQAWSKKDRSNRYVNMIISMAPQASWHGFNQESPRALNALYHPAINYDKDPMPQAYSLVRNGKWNQTVAA